MTKEITCSILSYPNLTANYLPVVIQHNKWDFNNAPIPQVLKDRLGYTRIPEVETVALQGIGILDTVKAILNRVMIQVQGTV